MTEPSPAAREKNVAGPCPPRRANSQDLRDTLTSRLKMIWYDDALHKCSLTPGGCGDGQYIHT